jgi:uncharacterized membrane protein YkoI
MRKRITAGAAIMAALAVMGGGIAAANGVGGSENESATSPPGPNGSRLDDGKGLLPQAKITEAQAIKAAQSAESGGLNEVDLEQYQGHLVFNVDVGAKDVKVDASNGNVLAATTGD